jgi:hypothetical protein
VLKKCKAKKAQVSIKEIQVNKNTSPAIEERAKTIEKQLKATDILKKHSKKHRKMSNHQ